MCGGFRLLRRLATLQRDDVRGRLDGAVCGWVTASTRAALRLMALRCFIVCSIELA